MKPGVIIESLETLEKECLIDLNLSIDEKFLSSGCQIKTDAEAGTDILGDQEFFGIQKSEKSVSIDI